MHQTDRIGNSVVDEIADVFKKHRKKKSGNKRLVFLLTVFLFLLPFLFSQAKPEQKIANPIVYHKIKRVTFEYPEDLQPVIMLRPSGSGCANLKFMEKVNFNHSSGKETKL